MNWRAVVEVAKVAFREFWRTPEAVFWTYGFPLVMTIVLGFAFRPAAPPPIAVAVTAGAAAEPLRARLASNPRLVVEVLSVEAADAALARGRVQALVRGTVDAPIVRADPLRPDAELARLQIERALDPRARVEPVFESEDRPGSRYVDFLVPGLVGLNLLGAGLWGIGYNLTQYREQKLLRRLLVTPLRRSEFLLGFLLSRLLLLVPESAVILLFGVFAWGVPFRGSVAAALVLIVTAAFAFIGLGILIASRARTVEGVTGLMNLCMLPMWLLGGAFFANDRFEGVLHWLAAALPLSQCNAALRDLLLSPAGFGDVVGPLAYLAAFAAVCFLLALRWFRWT